MDPLFVTFCNTLIKKVTLYLSIQEATVKHFHNAWFCGCTISNYIITTHLYIRLQDVISFLTSTLSDLKIEEFNIHQPEAHTYVSHLCSYIIANYKCCLIPIHIYMHIAILVEPINLTYVHSLDIITQ